MARRTHPAATFDPPGTDGNKRQRVPAESVVSALRLSGMQLTLNLDGLPYMAFDGPRFTRQPLNSAEPLIRHVYSNYCRNVARTNGADGALAGEPVLTKAVVADVIRHLEAEALHERERTPHFIRVCSDKKGSVYVDLGQTGYAIARVTADKFEPFVVDRRVPFVRPPGMRPMPAPKMMPGVMAEYRSLFPILSDDDFKLKVCFELGCLWPYGRSAILMISGGEGSWKTWLARTTRHLVDPHALENASMPTDLRDMVTAGHNARLVVWDNVSNLTDEQSDALCRRSDGATDAYNKKYTDAELSILRSAGPTVICGIPTLVGRADVARRSLFIGPGRPSGPLIYRDDEEMKRRISELGPGVLYELLNAIKIALRNLPSVQPVPGFSLPDFSRLAQAAAPAFGWTAEEIRTLLRAQVGRQRSVVAENSPLVMVILDWLSTSEGDDPSLSLENGGAVCWTGTKTELLNALNAASPGTRYSKDWPANASQLGSELMRLAAVLKQCGIVVEDGPRSRGHWDRKVRIRRLSVQAGYDEPWARVVGGADSLLSTDPDTLH
jgi:putative DNA primase/helicase